MKSQKMNYRTEEQAEMYKFLIVLFVVIGIIVGVYFISKIFIKNEVADLAYEAGVVSTDVAVVGTLLNNPEKEYYVLAYDTESNFASAFLTYAGYYSNTQKNATKIYYLALNNGMNQSYYVQEGSNPKATKIKDLKMLNGTLIKVKNGKIVKYVEGMDAVAKELKVTSEKN